jgi:hypothetical protein
MLANIGDRFRDAGDHANAVACYESTVRLGHLMRVDAYSILDGLTGIAVTRMVASHFLSAIDERAAEAIADKTARTKRMDEARVVGLCAYLREHGRPDVAAFYERDSAEAAAWRDASAAVPNIMVKALVDASVGPAIASGCAVWLLTATFLALAVILGLTTLATRPWRRPVTGLDWTYRDWLSLLIWAALPGALVGVFFDIRPQPMSYWWTAAVWAIPIACGIGFIVWLIRVGRGVRRLRAAMPPEDRPGKARCFFASLRFLTPPTLAALFLASVILLWPLSGAEKRENALTHAVTAKGEAAYWGINERAREVANQKPTPPGQAK